ncbi:MAG: hypothetical protein R3C12_13810 [Planctomycetaceae bacterium]
MSDIVQRMSLAHIKLCEGQGAEMEWTIIFAGPDTSGRHADLRLENLSRIRGGPVRGIATVGRYCPYEEMIPAFCRHLGVGFPDPERLEGLAWRCAHQSDHRAGRDGVASHVAAGDGHQAASPEQRTILENVLKGDPDSPLQRLELLKLIFEQTDAFNQAEMLVEKSREARRETLADAVQPESLRHYLYFLIDTVLAPEEGAAEPENGPVLVSLSFPEES